MLKITCGTTLGGDENVKWQKPGKKKRAPEGNGRPAKKSLSG